MKMKRKMQKKWVREKEKKTEWKWCNKRGTGDRNRTERIQEEEDVRILIVLTLPNNPYLG